MPRAQLSDNAKAVNVMGGSSEAARASSVSRAGPTTRSSVRGSSMKISAATIAAALAKAA